MEKQSSGHSGQSHPTDCWIRIRASVASTNWANMAGSEQTVWGIHGGRTGDADSLFLKKKCVGGWHKLNRPTSPRQPPTRATCFAAALGGDACADPPVAWHSPQTVPFRFLLRALCVLCVQRIYPIDHVCARITPNNHSCARF
jgi:hypothetical protein